MEKNILESDGSTRISVQPDGNSIFQRNGKYHLMTHFENYPGVAYMTELDKKQMALTIPNAIDT